MASNLGWWRPERVQSQIHLGPFRPLHVHSETQAHCSYTLPLPLPLCFVSSQRGVPTPGYCTCKKKQHTLTGKLCIQLRCRDLTRPQFTAVFDWVLVKDRRGWRWQAWGNWERQRDRRSRERQGQSVILLLTEKDKVRGEGVKVSDLRKEKRRKMKRGRKERYDRSIRDKDERGRGGVVEGGGGRQYVRVCYYSLRVGWRHEKQEEEEEEGGRLQQTGRGLAV